jgi:lipid-A-disaccharide synthase
MKPKSFMVIAGEASGDLLAAELVQALRREYAEAPRVPTCDYQPLHSSLEPRFFGAGGPRMAAAGVKVEVDMTQHSIIGLTEALKHLLTFRRIFLQLYHLALERQPDAIICVDFDGFNRRFAHYIKRYTRTHADWFHAWSPRLIRYVSPQVWASREGRAYQMASDLDLLLTTFPFEKDWYAQRVPQLRVEFTGNPIVDRYPGGQAARGEGRGKAAVPQVLLLPGSRPGELKRHLPVLVETANRIAATRKVSFRMVVPHENLLAVTKPLAEQIPGLELQVGQLEEALRTADLAITKSGTITLECAQFGVPAVVFYKTSAITYAVGRRMVTIKHIAMPNLLADDTLFPEFIQGGATGENLARAALELLNDGPRYQKIQTRLAQIVSTLGAPGASRRAAQAIMRLMGEPIGKASC